MSKTTPQMAKLKQGRDNARTWCLAQLWRLSLLLVVLAYSQATQAQIHQDSVVNSISRDILALITENLNKQVSFDVPDYSYGLDALFNLGNPKLELGDRDMIYANRIRQKGRDLGLRFKAQYYFNSDPFFNDNEYGYAFVRYRLRFGFDWEMLGDGLLGNIHQMNTLRKQQQLEQFEKRMEDNDDRLYFRYNLFIYYFNRAKIDLLEQRKSQLNRELELLYKVYFLKGIMYEDVINTRSRIEQINVQLATYKQYNKTMESTLDIASFRQPIDVYSLPILEVAIDSLVHGVSNRNMLDSINQLTYEIEKLKENPIKDISLRLLADENIGFIDDGTTDRTYTSLGVSFSMPISVLYSRQTRKDLINAKTDFRKKFNNYEDLNRQTEIVNYHYEYKYKLKQYVEFMHKEMLYQEKIRVEVISQENYLDIYRSLKILNYLDILRTVQQEQLDIKQQMYLLLLKIYGKTYHHSILPFVQRVNMADYYERLSANRTLSLKQEDLETHDLHFIKNYLLSNDFENIIVHTAPEERERADALREVLKDTDIGVFFIAANEQLIKDPASGNSMVKHFIQQGNYSGVLIDLTKRGTPVQIDQIKAFLYNLKDLISMVNYSTRSEIGIQLPVDYPYMSLARACDRVSLKLQNDQSIKLLDVVLKRGLINPENLFVTVEASRFGDRMELEGFIEQLIHIYHIENIIIEGLDDFISLDTNTLMRPE